MTVFCYLQVKSIQNIKFEFEGKKDLVNFLPDLLILEADNHSEAFTIQQSAELLKKGDNIVTFIEVEKDEKIGSLAKIFETLRKNNKTKILVTGQNMMLEKLAKMFPKEFQRISSNEDIQKRIIKLLKP